MAELVSRECKLLIQVLLTDSKIQERVFDNVRDTAKYKICDIRDDGNIVLGKTKYRWWNQLLNCQDKLTFESFALKVWDVLVDQSSGIANEAIIHGLSHEIIMHSVRNKDYNTVIRRLFDCWSHVAQKSEGFHKPELPAGSTDEIGQGRQVEIRHYEAPKAINLVVDGQKHVIPFVDSVGDSFNIGLEYGIKGVRRIY